MLRILCSGVLGLVGLLSLLALFVSSEAYQMSNLKRAIAGAIQKGAPVYNSGRPDLCYQIYKTVANQAVQQGLASTAEADVLTQALQTAQGQDNIDNGDSAAWTIRRAFDAILEDNLPRQASPAPWDVLTCERGAPAAPRWVTLDDRVMGGVSRSTLTYAPGGNGEEGGFLAFHGRVTTDSNGGFASVRSEDWPGWDFAGARGVELTVRGSNRIFKLSLQSDASFDSVQFQKDFIAGGGDWQTVRLDFNEFNPTLRGSVVPNYPKISGDQVRKVGFMVSKFSDCGGTTTGFSNGEFQLDIKSVRAYK